MSALQSLTYNVVSSLGDGTGIPEAELHDLIARHERLAHLCDQLEACADKLPVWPNEMEAGRLREALEAYVERAAEHEDLLVTQTFGRSLQSPLAEALIHHVDLRHIDDLIHAQDLIAALGTTPTANARISAETFGYMLRCFFAASRQAMVLEELAILMLGHESLTPDGKSLLINGLCRRVA
ncbi:MULTISPECIES: hypothetical protein [Methylobacterium]|jgi:hypothetical protein|uniref:hypothetical protein n=1 Tax=Methylobacterium TaxID=407 RepID=UPI0012ECE8A8|nr:MULTISPECIES: hypothetical protein [Methylobacterium]NGM37330.1 hypothetical protein [Methylobacterium sp. DB0501]UHC20314.1 hypothetical protein LRS73_34280 [Methylobacterium currus]